MSQLADKRRRCLICRRCQARVKGRESPEKGVRWGREPMAAALPDLAWQVCDGRNAVVAVRLHYHMRIAALQILTTALLFKP